jgi:23S rRNA pseudouridine2605 synthase
VELSDGKTSPCEIYVDEPELHIAYITLAEGRNHEVRRIFDKCGYDVLKLDRRSFGPLTSKGLARGEYRHLTKDEVATIEKMVKLDDRYNAI